MATSHTPSGRPLFGPTVRPSARGYHAPRTTSSPLGLRSLGRALTGVGFVVLIAMIVLAATLEWTLPALTFAGGFIALLGSLLWLTPGIGFDPSGLSRSSRVSRSGVSLRVAGVWLLGLFLAVLGGWLSVMLCDQIALQF